MAAKPKVHVCNVDTKPQGTPCLFSSDNLPAKRCSKLTKSTIVGHNHEASLIKTGACKTRNTEQRNKNDGCVGSVVDQKRHVLSLAVMRPR